MSRYIILNFEDKITDTQKGAADSTILGLKARYEVIKNPKGISGVFMSKNTVTEHRCVEAGPPIKLTDDATRISAIRAACGGAEKIYLVMHGDPRTTDVCYTNAVPSTAGVVQLVSAPQLAAFLAKVLVSTKQEGRLALIMCYGARCRDYVSANVNHQGMIPQADLVTSFAYRLFYALVHDHAVKARLSAVTGKISHDSKTGGAMVEVEEMIDLNMEFSEANSAKLASMRDAVGAPKALNEQDATYKASYAAWSSSPAGAALTQRVKTAQDARKAVVSKLPTEKASGSMHKYGKIEYRLKGSKLIIASKYGDSAAGLKAGTVLYSGDLLTPG
ncbi:MAG TPA: hypothetical protein VIG08_10595 [Gemmatimonadales bacterium]|jgi:hypothetical protein